jgi:PhnB protein
MAVINPYLNFDGNTEEAFNFYKSVFGGDFVMVMRFKDLPDPSNVPEKYKNKIMHISLRIGKDDILMGTDALESMGHKVTEGNNFSIAIGTDSKEEATRLFDDLSKGGKIEMPLDDMFWGAYYGSFTDKFGIRWMVSYQYKEAEVHK